MIEKDRDSFIQLLKQAALIFADLRPITGPLIATYWDVLYPYQIADISDAFDAMYHTRTYKGLPMPAEIRQAVHVTPPEIERPPELTFAELEGNSAKFRFCRYLMQTGKWREIGDDPHGRKWRGMYEAWESAGQPMPAKTERKRGLLKGMEA